MPTMAKKTTKKTAAKKTAKKPAAPKSTAKKTPTKSTTTKKAATKKVTKKTGKTRPTDEEIGALAFEIYADRVAHGKPGTPDGDWHEALRRLTGGR